MFAMDLPQSCSKQSCTKPLLLHWSYLSLAISHWFFSSVEIRHLFHAIEQSICQLWITAEVVTKKYKRRMKYIGWDSFQIMYHSYSRPASVPMEPAGSGWHACMLTRSQWNFGVSGMMQCCNRIFNKRQACHQQRLPVRLLLVTTTWHRRERAHSHRYARSCFLIIYQCFRAKET